MDDLIKDAGAGVGSKRKLARKSLTLREKSIVKSFCEQKVSDCRARGELAPSQELLRREVATQFGWSVGRSTLSKIISMDWKLLRGSQEGGDAPRNPDMKRRRRPLFPALEADLVKFISVHLGEDEGNVGVTGGDTQSSETGSSNGERKNAAQGRVLTEALILEEAQRLKQVHSVSDDKLVLSVGWLARFKHRHCIRLRKPANKVAVPLQQALGDEPDSTELAPIGAWNATLLAAGLSQPQVATEYSIMTENSVECSSDNPSSEQCVTLDSTVDSPPSMTPQLCSAQWYQEKAAMSSSATAARLEQLPDSVRGLACSCQGSATDDDLTGGIAGLRVAVVGFGSIVKAFLAAAAVGASGFVACVEASPASVYLAEQAAESYCLETLGLPDVNIKFIVGEYGGMSSSSTEGGGENGLKTLLGQSDLVICNCSIQSLEFPASKNAMLQLALSLVRVGGELRVTDLVCSRRLSSNECEETRLGMEASSGTDGSTSTGDAGSKLFEQKLLLGAPYIGDLQRLYRSLGSDVEIRTVSCNAEEASAIDTAVVSLLPSLANAGDVRFRRVTFHVFRLEDVEDPLEDYGQTAVFNGGGIEDKTAGLADSLLAYRLDDDWNFQRGVCTQIDGNTAQILMTSWMQRYFSVNGDRSRHRGPFVVGVHSTCPSSSASSVPGTGHSSGVGASASGQSPSSTEPLEMVDI